MQAHRHKDLAANDGPSSRQLNDERRRKRPRLPGNKYDQKWAKPSLAGTHQVHGEKRLARIEQRCRAPDGRNPDPAGQARVGASVGHTDTLHQVRGTGPGLGRMAVLLQRAVLIAAAVANTMFATSKWGDINE